MRSWILKITAAGSLVALGLMGSLQAASAATTPHAGQIISPPSTTLEITSGMVTDGFNAAVAKAHGYEIRTNAQGVQYSVKIGSTGISPGSDPVKYGTCGASYVYYGAIGSRSASPKYGASYSTGYDLIMPAVEGNWTVDFVDNAGVGYIFWGSAANGTSGWNASGDTWHSVTGYSYAEVNTSSWALLDNGEICVSTGPWDSTTLTAA